MTTYSELESSIHGGRPVELFRFVHGADIWTYSNGPEITYNGETYISFPIGRDGELEQTNELHKSPFGVLIPRTSPISMLYLTGYPEHIMSLTIFRQHHGATGTVVYWKGRVTSADRPDDVTCRLTCEPIFTRLKQPGLRARYSRQCRHSLYRPECGVDKDDFAVAGTVAAISANKKALTVNAADALADGWFQGGMLATPTGGFLFIASHAGATITLQNPCGLAVGSAVTLYPGCNLSRETCKNKFDNILNFGGQPWIPLRNLFDGRSVV